MKTYGRLFQTAEIELTNDEWGEADRQKALSDAETFLCEEVNKVTDGMDIDSRISPTNNAIVFTVTFYNDGFREHYPGIHDFDGKHEDVDEIDVEDPETEIREQSKALEDLLDCDVCFFTSNKEWRENESN